MSGGTVGRVLHETRAVGGPWFPCPWQYGAVDPVDWLPLCDCDTMAADFLARLAEARGEIGVEAPSGKPE